MTLVMALSTFFMLKVGGISGASSITAGTGLGDALSRTTFLDPVLQTFIKGLTGPESDKQEDPLVVLPVLTDDHTVRHVSKPLHYVVNLCSPDADPRRLEDRIRPNKEGGAPSCQSETSRSRRDPTRRN